MPKTLLLDTDEWDLVLDANGDIALAGEPYAISQDVASAIRTFKKDCWYDQRKGMPYWQQILGRYPPMALVRAAIVKEAMGEPKVAQVAVRRLGIDGRLLTGDVLVVDTDGRENGVAF